MVFIEGLASRAAAVVAVAKQEERIPVPVGKEPPVSCPIQRSVGNFLRAAIEGRGALVTIIRPSEPVNCPVSYWARL